MQIRIEIDLKPEELRTFLGLPDVAGIQEDLIKYAREKLANGVEEFDPANFVKENVDVVRGTKAWQRIVKLAFGEEDLAEETPARSRKAKSTAKKKSTD